MKDLSKWCGLTGAKQGKYETQTYLKHYDVIIFLFKAVPGLLFVAV